MTQESDRCKFILVLWLATVQTSTLTLSWYLFKRFIYLFTYYFLLYQNSITKHKLHLVVASGGYSFLQGRNFSLQWLLWLCSMGSRVSGSLVSAHGLKSAGSVTVAHGPSCLVAGRILPDHGSVQCPLHWQVDS